MQSRSINDSLMCLCVFLNVKNKYDTQESVFGAHVPKPRSDLLCEHVDGRVCDFYPAAYRFIDRLPPSPVPFTALRRRWRLRRRRRAECGRRATGLGMTRATVRGRQRCPPPLHTPGHPRPRCCSTSSPPLYRITIAATAWMGSQTRSHTRARAIIGGGGGGSNDQTRPNVTVVYTPAYTTSAAAALATLAAAAATVAGQSRRNLLRRAIVTFPDVTFPSFTTSYYHIIFQSFFFFLISILLLFLFPVTVLPFD